MKKQRTKRFSDISIPTEEKIVNAEKTKLDSKDDVYSDNIRKATVNTSSFAVDHFRKPIFDIDEVITKLSESLFDIDIESRIILGVIAKNGPVNENQIIDLGFKESHNITRDIVRYRISNEKNTKNLIKKTLIIQKDGKKIGNIRNKVEKKYYLTSRGLFASLAKTTFEKNYMVINYKELIKDWIKSYDITEFVILAIKYDLALLMIKSKVEGFRAEELGDVESRVFSLNLNDPLIDPIFYKRIYKTNSETIYEDTRHMFHVYQQVINVVLKRLFVGPNNSPGTSEISYDKSWENESEKAVLLRDYIRFFYPIVEELQFEDLARIDPYLFLYKKIGEFYVPKDEANFFMSVWNSNRILEKLGISNPKKDDLFEIPDLWELKVQGSN